MHRFVFRVYLTAKVRDNHGGHAGCSAISCPAIRIFLRTQPLNVATNLVAQLFLWIQPVPHRVHTVNIATAITIKK
jgi:hypothetical protein